MDYCSGDIRGFAFWVSGGGAGEEVGDCELGETDGMCEIDGELGVAIACGGVF